MTSKDKLSIGGEADTATAGGFRAVDPSTAEEFGPAFASATPEDLERACAAAADAFDDYRARPLEERAVFLEAIAQNILDIGDELIELCMHETGLPRTRLEGERGRTVNQLRLFAQVVRDGGFLDLRIDPAQPDRQPLPRVDLRLRNIPLGPVAVFGASNFPIAFSVAGGDTASALAAGCPVVVKAHSAHPGTSRLVGEAIKKAIEDRGLPAGVFSLVYDSGFTIGQGLVADPRIKAVGFTGSRRGGMALMKIASERAEPIPIYAEMSSINPVLLFPGALAVRGAEIGRAFAVSLTLGAGQFCTNPGLVLAVEGPGFDTFLDAAGEALAAIPATTMLTPGILKAFETGVSKLSRHGDVALVASGPDGGAHRGRAALFATTANAFLKDQDLHEEVFGAASLVVRCPDTAAVRRILEGLEGQLTATLHIEEADTDAVRSLLPVLERKVGRILVNGFGTGVEVAHAMVHGGPFPATSDGRTTSVGSLAISRFLRPVCYQDLPDALLPDELRGSGLPGLPKRLDGKLQS